MYAVIESGGKQYKVCVGDKLDLEKLEGDVGSVVSIDRVLMVSDGAEVKIGKPVVEGAEVVGRIANQHKSKKVLIFKKKRRKGYRKTQGHRQLLTQIEITEIKA